MQIKAGGAPREHFLNTSVVLVLFGYSVFSARTATKKKVDALNANGKAKQVRKPSYTQRKTPSHTQREKNNNKQKTKREKEKKAIDVHCWQGFSAVLRPVKTGRSVPFRVKCSSSSFSSFVIWRISTRRNLNCQNRPSVVTNVIAPHNQLFTSMISPPPPSLSLSLFVNMMLNVNRNPKVYSRNGGRVYIYIYMRWLSVALTVNPHIHYMKQLKHRYCRCRPLVVTFVY